MRGGKNNIIVTETIYHIDYHNDLQMLKAVGTMTGDIAMSGRRIANISLQPTDM
jgi:hypothetical protein